VYTHKRLSSSCISILTHAPKPSPVTLAAYSTPRFAAKEDDVVDEAIRLFRANVLFRNFEVQGGADRVLVYLTLFIHQCLKRVEKKPNKAEALRELSTLAQGAHYIPGDPGWPLGQVMPLPKSASEAESLRLYFRQLREGLVPRLVERLYLEDGSPNRHWMAYAKRKFMGKEFP
jgi:actin related protein 2/3 complex subunit 3